MLNKKSAVYCETYPTTPKIIDGLGVWLSLLMQKFYSSVSQSSFHTHKMNELVTVFMNANIAHPSSKIRYIMMQPPVFKFTLTP